MPALPIVRLAIASTVLCASMLDAAAPAHADRLLVGFHRAQASASDRAHAIADAGASSKALVLNGPGLAIDAATTGAGASPARVKQRLEADPRVAWVLPDRL